MARLRDAVFVPAKRALHDLMEELRRDGWTDEDIANEYHKNYSWFLTRVPRKIPGPTDLLHRLKEIERAYANIPDYKTGVPLFRPGTWAAWRKFLEHVRRGCLSDHPDIPLYIYVALDGSDKELLRCFRGSNALEGYHLHIAKVTLPQSVYIYFIEHCVLYIMMHKMS